MSRKRILPPNYLKVVSLFDGISCLRVALERQGFNVDYYASEIDTNAIKISVKNYFSTHLGDVKGVGYIPNVDLLCGGSPCTDLSIAKKNREGLAGARSGLFYEYVRILHLIKPKWFILENVASMAKADRDEISLQMGVQPIMIDASLVSAQSRKRLFWTNIPVVGLPVDRGIKVKDILEPDAEVDERMLTKAGKAHCIDANYHKGSSVEHSIAKGVRTQVKIGRDIGRRLKDGVRCDDDMTIPITRRVETRTDEKSGTLTSVMKDNVVVNTETTHIRKLTPLECERLQGLPDGYTEGVATTHRFRALGNAFNVDVVAFILSFIPTKTDTK